MTADPKLWLRLPLNEVRDGNLRDLSGNGNHAIVHGDPEVQYDDALGSVLVFDGENDYVELPALELEKGDGFTFEAWVRFDAFQKNSRVFDFADGIGPSALLLGNEGTGAGLMLWTWDRSGKNHKNMIQKDCLAVGAWTHLAVTATSGGTATLFRNGALTHEEPLLEVDGCSRKRCYLGRSNWHSDGRSSDELLKGAMAQVRVYKRVLSQEEIQTHMKVDRSSAAQFRDAYPVQVDVYSVVDEAHQPVLFIEEGNRGEPLELSLAPTGTTPLTLKALPTDSPDWHVQLRFRKRVLSEALTKAWKEKGVSGLSEGWKARFETTNDREDLLSLRWTGAGDQTATLDHPLVLRLEGVNAGAFGGSRATRVEVCYQNFTRGTETARLSGSVIRHLQIVSHEGQKNSPLVAGLLGSNTILNDEKSENEFVLTLRNSDPIRPVHLLGTDTHPEGPSRIRVSIVGTVEDSAKNLHAAPADFDLDGKAHVEGWKLAGPTSADSLRQWTLTPNAGVELKEQTLELSVTKLVAKSNSGGAGDGLPWMNGTAQVLVSIENVPGFWDATRILPLQVGPLVMRGQNVGIGTDEPTQTLDVKGSLMVSDKALFDGNVGVGVASVDNKLEVRGATRLWQPDANRTLQVNNNSPLVGSTSEPAVLIWNEGEGAALHVSKGISILEQKVRVGSDLPPTETLDVSGSLKVSNNVQVGGRITDKTGDLMPVGAVIAYAGKTPPPGWLVCKGQPITEEKYADLRTALGENKVPDLRARFIFGQGSGYNRWSKGGQASVKLRIGHMPRHSHTGVTNEDGAHYHRFLNRAMADNDDNDNNHRYVTGNTEKPETHNADDLGTIHSRKSEHVHHFTTHNEGSGEAHNNLPPYYALYYIIKY